MTLGTASIIRGNALDLPLADGAVDLIVTSPPYFGLRSYQDGGAHYAGQIGDEATPAEFVDALVAATAEMVRVLKTSGSMWINLGDKYAGSMGSPPQSGFVKDGSNKKYDGRQHRKVERRDTIPTKSLIGVPWRYALRCIDDLGLILRAEVIWAKPNGLPESVTDRVRRSHETWFHFVRSPRYFSAVDEIREEHVATATGRDTSGWRTGPSGQNRGTDTGRRHDDGGRVADFATSPLGKLPGSVWTIPTQPLRVPESLGVDHFAAFPMDWPRRIIRGWAPTRGVCVECGEGRRPVVERGAPLVIEQSNPKRLSAGEPGNGTVGFRYSPNGAAWNAHKATNPDTITGEACACPGPTVEQAFEERDEATGERVTHVFTVRDPTWQPTAPTRPATILDPFGGTGTTALVAKALGCHGISNDMSSDYCRLATWRTNDEGELARALEVAKPAEQIAGQASLLDLIDSDGGAA